MPVDRRGLSAYLEEYGYGEQEAFEYEKCNSFSNTDAFAIKFDISLVYGVRRSPYMQ